MSSKNRETVPDQFGTISALCGEGKRAMRRKLLILWSGREDLNLRPPDPQEEGRSFWCNEINGLQGKSLFFCKQSCFERTKLRPVSALIRHSFGTGARAG